MVISCSALGCTNRWNKDRPEIRFHRFPLKKPELLSKWLVALKRDKFVPSQYVHLCSAHFEDSDFWKTSGRRILKDDATPSVFNCPSHLQKGIRRKTNRHRPRKRSFQEASTSTAQEATDIEFNESGNASSIGDHNYCILSSDNINQTNGCVLDNNSTKRKEIKCAQQTTVEQTVVRETHCIVPGCRNKTWRTDSCSLSFFRFPKDEARRSLWIQHINPILAEKSVKYLRSLHVCGLHFTDDQFTSVLRSRLTCHAVPTLELLDLSPQSSPRSESGSVTDFRDKTDSSDVTNLKNALRSGVNMENFEASSSVDFEMLVNVKLENDISSYNEIDIKQEPIIYDEDDNWYADNQFSNDNEHEIECQINSNYEDDPLSTHNEESEIKDQVNLKIEVDPHNVTLTNKVKIECESDSNHEDDSLSTRSRPNCDYGVRVKEENSSECDILPSGKCETKMN